MGLQRFKLDVANAVVNTDNASLASMDTSQVLDLFAPPGQPGQGLAAPDAAGAPSWPAVCTRHAVAYACMKVYCADAPF